MLCIPFRLCAELSEFLSDPKNGGSELLQFSPITDKFLLFTLFHTPGLVAVHCTHGLNRTGYLICRFNYILPTLSTIVSLVITVYLI